MSPRAIGVSVLLIGAVAASAGDLLPYHRRARINCGLSPCYDYRPRSLSGADVRETSATVFLDQVAAPPNSSLANDDPMRRLRIWQVVDRDLTVDHCSASGIAIWIDESGRWSVNLKATQSPFVVNGPDRQATPATRFLRNKFYLKLRAHGLAKTADPNRTSTVGQPEIFAIDLNPFWVERDTTIRWSQSGVLTPEQLARLPLVDRMEVEFRYE